MHKEPITKGTEMLMIGTAIFYDVLQILFGLILGATGIGAPLVPVFDNAINIVALLTFSVWFWAKGRSFFRGRKKALRLIAMGTEVLPLVPGWTVSVWVTVKMLQSEDKERAHNTAETGGVRRLDRNRNFKKAA